MDDDWGYPSQKPPCGFIWKKLDVRKKQETYVGFRKQGKVGIGREKDFSPFHKTKVGIDQAKIGDSAANLWV